MKLQMEYDLLKDLNQSQSQLYTKEQSQQQQQQQQQQQNNLNIINSNNSNQSQPQSQKKKSFSSKLKIIDLHNSNRVLKSNNSSYISRRNNKFNNSLIFKVYNEIKIIKKIKYNKLNRTRNLKNLIKKILNQIKVVPKSINSKQQPIGSVSTSMDIQTLDSVLTPMDIQTLGPESTPMDIQTLDSVSTPMDTQTLGSEPTSMDLQYQPIISFNSEINYKDIQIINQLGSGGCGTVFMGAYKNSNVAIKRSTPDSSASFNNEIEITKKFNHQNIVKYIGTVIDASGEKLLVTELLKQDIAKIISMQPKLPVHYKIKMAKDIAFGIKEIHASGVIHRDLKLENLMIDDNNVVKIIDFGISCDTNKIETLNSLYLGTIQYMAPEIFLNQGFTQSVDIYSFGIILFEIISSRRVGSFLGNMPTQQANPFLMDHKFLPNFNGIEEFIDNHNLKFLVERCWNPIPKNRPSSDEIISILNTAYIHYSKI